MNMVYCTTEKVVEQVNTLWVAWDKALPHPLDSIMDTHFPANHYAAGGQPTKVGTTAFSSALISYPSGVYMATQLCCLLHG